jgi:hypothetical protein
VEQKNKYRATCAQVARQWKTNMKKIITLVLAISCTLQLQLASAQSAEVTQLLLNIEKLAQLKQILSDMKKGYDIVSKGYNTVRDISKGNFNLHDQFLNGLLLVNPNLAKYRKVADIITYQQQLLKEYKSAFTRFKAGGRFRPEELEYLSTVYGNLFDGSLDNLDELAMIVTSSKLRMSDDERIEGIDRIYSDMQEKLSFLRSFNKRTDMLDRQRAAQQAELDALKKVNGLN